MSVKYLSDVIFVLIWSVTVSAAARGILHYYFSHDLLADFRAKHTAFRGKIGQTWLRETYHAALSCSHCSLPWCTWIVGIMMFSITPLNTLTVFSWAIAPFVAVGLWPNKP